MVKDIGRSFTYNRSKISSTTLKKPVLSSSENYTLYTTNLARTIIASQLENEESTEIKNTSDILNTDGIHSYATPQKHNISVQATYTPPRLTPFITNLPLAPVELKKNRITPSL